MRVARKCQDTIENAEFNRGTARIEELFQRVENSQGHDLHVPHFERFYMLMPLLSSNWYYILLKT